MLAMAGSWDFSPAVFTDEQNAVLREVLLKFMDRNQLNQPSMAKMLHIEQPSVGRYIQAKNPTGFAYPVATKIARLAGYIGVDALFAAKGVALDARATDPDPTTHGTQAQAMTVTTMKPCGGSSARSLASREPISRPVFVAIVVAVLLAPVVPCSAPQRAEPWADGRKPMVGFPSLVRPTPKTKTKIKVRSLVQLSPIPPHP